MANADTKIKDKVYSRTVLHSGMCFDTTEEIHKAQEFLCLLIKRGVIKLCEEEQIEFDFTR